MKLFTLIPVKNFACAKQRLSSILSPEEREALAEAMFRDVLGQTVASRAVAAIFVVTADPRAAGIASSQGAQVIREKSPRGETKAVCLAMAELKRRGVPSALVIPADIPLLRSADLEFLLERAESYATAPAFGLLVPSRDHDGTNAVLLSPPDLISPSFGDNSFSRHLSCLRAQGIRYEVVENENIGLDIDKADDLRSLLSQEVAGKTREKLLGFQWGRLQRGMLSG